MKNYFNRVIKRILKGSYFGSLYDLKENYLKKEGWNLSVKYRKPVDRDGNELPWFTYSSIDFIKERINSEFSIFEFGSGNSTIWFSQKVRKVVSVEHDAKWFSIMKDKILERMNVTYIFGNIDTNEYANSVLNYSNEFDLIIIDGRQRIECCMNSLDALKENGVIVWDNSDRPEYDEGYKYLKSNAFKRLDFWGMGPINAYSWCTSIFYRNNNCLNI